MASKINRESMIEFITANREVYAGKADLSNLNQMADEDLQKVFRAVKTKVWSLSKKKSAVTAKVESIQSRIETAATYEDALTLRSEIESYLSMADERILALKAEKIESLEQSIQDCRQQLKELKG